MAEAPVAVERRVDQSAKRRVEGVERPFVVARAHAAARRVGQDGARRAAPSAGSAAPACSGPAAWLRPLASAGCARATRPGARSQDRPGRRHERHAQPTACRMRQAYGMRPGRAEFQAVLRLGARWAWARPDAASRASSWCRRGGTAERPGPRPRAPAPPSPAAAGRGAPAVVQVIRPKRDALWKLPCPRMGDHATPPLFFMA